MWVEVYSDYALSGGSLHNRPGVQALLETCNTGVFDILLAEALDRISRDQEDIAAIYKRLQFAGVSLSTLAEGEISELHIGLKGTMNALFLKDLANKTRRGLEGRIRQGRSGGGNAYGYDVIREYGPDGPINRGRRQINASEATTVRRIFREYLSGKSPRAIAYTLNAEREPGPRGKGWTASTIIGNRKRGTGILNNELYIGRLVWNRQKFIKNPQSGKRQARPNPQSAWVIEEVPDLRIIDQQTWDDAASAQYKRSRATRPDASPPIKVDGRQRRPKHLFSGDYQMWIL